MVGELGLKESIRGSGVFYSYISGLVSYCNQNEKIFYL